MGDSTIDFRDRSVRIHEAKMELAACMIMGAAGNDAIGQAPWLLEMFQSWKDQIMHAEVGCLDLGLDRFVLGSDRAEAMLRLIEKAIEKVQSFGEEIPIDYVNSLAPEPWKKGGGVAARHALEALDAMRELITGPGH